MFLWFNSKFTKILLYLAAGTTNTYIWPFSKERPDDITVLLCIQKHYESWEINCNENFFISISWIRNFFFIHKVYPLHARSELLILIKRNVKDILHYKSHYSANIYLFKVNNRITRKRCEIYLKLTIKTPERCHWHRLDVVFC